MVLHIHVKNCDAAFYLVFFCKLINYLGLTAYIEAVGKFN